MSTRYLYLALVASTILMSDAFGQEMPEIIIGSKADIEDIKYAEYFQKGATVFLAYILAPVGGAYTIYEGFNQYKAALKTNQDKQNAYLMMVAGMMMLSLVKLLPMFVEWLGGVS